MGDPRRDRLRRTYLSLGAGELVAASVFALMAHFSVAPRLNGPDTLALWSALVPLIVVLVQGGAYWVLARSWVGGAERAPEGVRTAYRLFRVVDPVLLGAGALGLLVWWPSGIGAAALCGLIWLFGVAEYVNYFVMRLAYPPSRWFSLVGQRRTPQLVRDVG